MLGFTEILVILLIALFIFGARRIPELGRSLGGGIKNFKNAIQDDGSFERPGEPEESDRD